MCIQSSGTKNLLLCFILAISDTRVGTSIRRKAFLAWFAMPGIPLEVTKSGFAVVEVIVVTEAKESASLVAEAVSEKESKLAVVVVGVVELLEVVDLTIVTMFSDYPGVQLQAPIDPEN